MWWGKGKMTKDIKNRNEYDTFIQTVGRLLEEYRKKAYQEVNSILVDTYWEIGRRIVEFEQKGREKAEYGSGLLNKLSKDLTFKYGKGFSIDNLERMRRFFLYFPNSAALSRKLSWSHYLLILRIEEPLARQFYQKEVETEGWGTRELSRQINSQLFERIALSKDKKGVLALALKGQVIERADNLIKDPYVLEFLGLKEEERYTENLLEERIISNLKEFLLELGKGFTFVARQQRITIEDEHFYVDLVFYNRLLRCFVIIELKIGKLTHQDIGQLQMYVNYYNRSIKQKDENPTIGIILCADKKDTLVKYTLPEDNKHIFASRYKLYLPNKKQLEAEVRKLLNTDKL